MIYEPDEDSELLLEVALKEIRPDDEVIEIGSGSGFVAERIIGKCKLLVVTDISPHAVRVLKQKGLDVIRTDIARGIRKKFTLVLFNPPYLELEEDLKRGDWLDVAVDGGKGGIEVISRFLKSLPEILDENGRAILIISSQNEPHIYKLLEEERIDYEIAGKRELFFETIYALKLRFSRE